MPSVFAQDFPTKQSALFIACPCFNTTYHPHQYLSHYLLVDMSREFGMLFTPPASSTDRDYHHFAEEGGRLNSTRYPDGLILKKKKKRQCGKAWHTDIAAPFFSRGDVDICHTVFLLSHKKCRRGNKCKIPLCLFCDTIVSQKSWPLLHRRKLIKGERNVQEFSRWSCSLWDGAEPGFCLGLQPPTAECSLSQGHRLLFVWQRQTSCRILFCL